MNALSELGFGKSTMETIIMDEVEASCNLLSQKVSSNGGRLKLSRAFSPATNNVIWRIVSGKRSKQDDPSLEEFMEISKEVFMFFETDDLVKVLQINSIWFAKFCKWIGVKINVFDTPAKLKRRLLQEAMEGVADPMGSYIDRHLDMEEQNKENTDSVFHPSRSKVFLRAALWDLFLAGIMHNCMRHFDFTK